MKEEQVMMFSELAVGWAFRPLFGRRALRKHTAESAALIGSTVSLAQLRFAPEDRCVRLPDQDYTKEQLNEIYYRAASGRSRP